MMGIKGVGSLSLSLPIIIAALAAGAGIILTTGLLCGLVARPNNCIERPMTTTTTTTTPTTTTTRPASLTTTTTITTTNTGTTSATTPGASVTASTSTASTSTARTTTQFTGTPGSVTPRDTTTGPTLPPLTTGSTIPPVTPDPTAEFRLLKNLSPLRYNLLLRFDYDPYSSTASDMSPDFLDYTGEVTIEFQATAATNQIVLHMDQGITLTDQNVYLLSNGVLQSISDKGYKNNQRYQINVTNTLQLGSTNVMQMKFKARTTREGFYYHGYQESFQRERSVLGTSFLPDFARTAFPCFDEPSFKAEFNVTIEHPLRTFALSNYPVLSSVEFNDGNKDKIRTTFEVTKQMSTYSLGWAVLPEDFGKKSVDFFGTDITIYGRASEINIGLGDFALDTFLKSLLVLESKFGTPDALPPKIDLIALPYFPDFSSPSWGVNGFTESDLFYLPEYNSVADKQFTALKVAEEAAHNWFGDYITCEFWDDVWIQEGLAQYYKYVAVNEIFPEWDILNQYLVDNTVPAMWLDGYESSLPLKFVIYTGPQLKFLFSDLLYKKSAALMRMVSSIVGEAEFELAINKLLASDPFGTYDWDSFASFFTAPTGWPITIKEYLQPYVIQGNLPQITLIKDDTTNRVVFVQNRFLLVILDIETDFETVYEWEVYLECKAGGTPGDPLAGSIYEFTYLLSSSSGSVQLPGAFDWVKCNKDFNGYYITDYGDSQFLSYETVMVNTPDVFSIGDRVNLIHTSFEMAWLGTHSYGPPALVTVYLELRENNISPWKTFFYHADRIALVSEHRESFRNLRGFVNQEIIDAIARLNIDLYTDSGDHLEELLKIEFVNQLGRMQNLQALNKFSELFNTIQDTYFINPENIPNGLSTNLRGLIYKYHLQNANNFNDWFDLYSFFFITNDAREKDYTMAALGNTRLNFLFDLILDDLLFDPSEKIPIEFAPILLSSMGTNPTGRYFAWYYIREYWGDFFLRGADMRKLSYAMYDITSSFESLLLVDEAATFFLQSYDFENTDIRLRILETGLNNWIWVLDREESLMDYFVVPL